MKDIKKNKNNNFLNFLKDLSFKYKKEINNILDITIIEDDQLKLLKDKILKVNKNLNCFLNKTVISPSLFKKLDIYLSFIDKEKNINLKFNNINIKKLSTPTNLKNIQGLGKLNKFTPSEDASITLI